MKIIEIKNKHIERGFPRNMECKRCGTRFEYIASDIISDPDPRDYGRYIRCPNDNCKSLITHNPIYES